MCVVANGDPSGPLQIFLLTQVEMSRPSSVIASNVPDCLLPVANREVLDIQLEALERYA